MKTVTYRHPKLGFSLAVPESWEQNTDTLDAPLVAVESFKGQLMFRANAVIAVDTLNHGLAPADQHSQSIEKLREYLYSFRLIDREEAQLGGRVVCRTLGHHIARPAPITVEQWLHFGSAHCYTLTASVNTLEYAVYRDTFAAMAYGFRLPEGES